MDLDPNPSPQPPRQLSSGNDGMVSQFVQGHVQSLPMQQNNLVGDGSLPQERRPKKSSTTCAICRFRKVRCNGARPTCANCQRLGFPCSYDDADADVWSMSLPRRRVKQACLSCHSRKARCSGHIPSCERCRAQGIDCIYRPSKRSKPAQGGSIDGKSPTSPERDLERDWAREKDRSRNPDDGRNESPASTEQVSVGSPGGDNLGCSITDESFDSIVVRAFELFFRHVHHMPMFSFLHRASLMEQYHTGNVDKPLLFAIIGVTSCLTDMGPGMRQYGNRCIERAEALLFSDYNRPSTIKIQALVLIIKHRLLCNKFSNAFVLHSMASRFAAALRLNYEAPYLCFLAQESRRRLMWSMYCVDTSVCGGYPDFILWRADRIHVGLPCNERNFEFDLPQHTEKLIPDSHQPRPPNAEDVGSLALHVRILHIRQRITEFTKVAQFDQGMEAAELQGRILALDKELDDFATNLPSSFQFSENSLRLRAYSPRIIVFVMIHVWWRQCHCDLYRLALAGIHGGLPQPTLDMFDHAFLDHCHRKCVDHSLALTNIFAAMQKLNAKPVADIDLAMCSYQCARMLRYLFQVGFFDRFGVTPETVMDQAQLCLQTIRDCCVGPAVDCIRTDLERLISQGIGTGISPLLADTSEGSMVAGTGANPNISQSVILRNLQITDESDILSAATSAVHPVNANSVRDMTPTPSSTVGSGASPFTHPVMSAPWMSDENFPQNMERQGLPEESQEHHHKGEISDLSSRAEFIPSELNNAYEGAFDGLGMDNGLDYGSGVDMNLWTANGGSWMTQGFVNSWGGF